MKHVDLCSGIGGFALGFQWANLSEPVLFCDIEPWSRRVLRKHWPDVPIAEDVKELAHDPTRLVPDCDILTAGYPCQPFSVAGNRRGEKDDRHIWPEILTIVKEKRPAWCVFENVYGHISMGLDEVLLDLETIGYATRPFVVPACAVDAPHRRDRVWIIARTLENARHGAGRHKWVAEGGQDASGGWAANTSQASGSGEQSETVADTKGQHRDDQKHRKRGKATTKSGVRAQAGASGEDVKQRSRSSWSIAGGVETWGVEPNVGRVAHGLSRRLDRTRGLGNAIVPQIAQQIGEVILAIETR